ncbi:endonuclease V [Chitinimonas viridis]|uniref:Endonuclease V n=1 Tax=Chitinimonas viridis TaxID=664880 RepID=A0ABT8B4E4_9NEIS|nr:endonuclease V [Chitinimonas viridis]MDN3577127.1 endonuclease V [Chitinimonas viridis]
MILAVDVDYAESGARVAGVMFKEWQDAVPDAIYVSEVADVAEYIPGQFYKRELPCILKLLEEYALFPDLIVIDGHVYLDGEAAPGLGAHLYHSLQGAVPVVGVAKTAYAGISPECEVYRGESGKPLYVSCVGMAIEEAKQKVASMHGPYRIPTLLKKVDQVCRGRG